MSPVKRVAVTALVLMFATVLFVLTPMKAQIKETNQRVSLVDGNELYGWCAVAQRVMTPSGDTVTFSGSREDAVTARSCWAYIEGVIDSTPAGDEFNPGPKVRLSQYIDVVTDYLKVHASIRNQPASGLVQRALKESFSHP